MLSAALLVAAHDHFCTSHHIDDCRMVSCVECLLDESQAPSDLDLRTIAGDKDDRSPKNMELRIGDIPLRSLFPMQP